MTITAGLVVVDDWGEPELKIRRAEHRIALVKHGVENEILIEKELIAGVYNSLTTSKSTVNLTGDWKATRLKYRTGRCFETDKPVLTENGTVSL